MSNFQFYSVIPNYAVETTFLVRIDPQIERAEELLNALYYGLWFPGYFGFNWNALYDCLSDLSWLPTKVAVVYHQVLPGLEAKDLKMYLDILQEASANTSKSLDIKFVAAFHGDVRIDVEKLLATD